MVNSRLALTELDMNRADGKWSIAIDGTEYIAPVVIMAVGPLITKMKVAHHLMNEREVVITRSVVGILHKRICQRILVFRDQSTNLLNLSPFTGGTSLNLGLKDDAVQDMEDQSGHLDLTSINAALTEYLPGIGRYPSTRAHFYHCHKYPRR